MSVSFFLKVDCEWGDWNIGNCSSECGGGIQIHTRTPKVIASHGGVDCYGLPNVTKICNINKCPGKKVCTGIFPETSSFTSKIRV